MAEAALIVVCIALAHMTAGYAKRWVAARKMYKGHEFHELNEFYVKFGERDPADYGLSLADATA